MKSLNGENAARSLPGWQQVGSNDRPLHSQIREKASDSERVTRLLFLEQQASRLRSACFEDLKLRNPSWDMLIALMSAKRSGRQLSMSDLCLACDAPESTALRLIHQLRDKGYAEMVPDRSDRRRTRVSLTQLGETQFALYFSRVEAP